MELQFSINGTVVDHPINWKDIKIRYKRDDVVRGLFTLFSSEIIWTGNEYKILSALYNSLTCDKPDFLVETRCGRFETWTTLMEGKLLLEDSKIDKQKCTLACTAEQSGCQGVFFNNIEKDYDIGQEGTAGVDSWLEITDLFQVCGVVTQPTPPLCYNYSPIVPVGGCFGKSYTTIFTQLIDLASGGCLGFVSDYFSTAIITEVWELDIQVASNIGDLIRIEWDDMFGNHHKHEIISLGNAVADAELIHWTLIYMPQFPTAPFVYGALYGANRYNKGEAAYTGWAGGLTKYEVIFHYPPSNMTLTTVSGTITWTQLSPGDVEGGSNFVIVPSLFRATGNYVVTNVVGVNWAVLAPRSYQLNFKQFFEIADKIFNLGMQIEPDGIGGWRVRIEPIEYFYSAVATVQLRELENVEHSSLNELFANEWRFGKETDQENTSFKDFNPEQSTFPGNIDVNESCNSEWWVISAHNCTPVYDRRYTNKEWVNGVGITFEDEMLTGLIENENFNYIIQTYTNTPGNPYVARQYRFDAFYFATAFIQPYISDLYRYDIHNQPQHIYLRHRNILPEHDMFTSDYSTEGTQLPGAGPWVDPCTFTHATIPVTIPEGAYWLPYRWKFNDFITASDWAAIVNSQQIEVNEGSDPLDDVAGYLKEVTYRIWDGYTEFLIETKS